MHYKFGGSTAGREVACPAWLNLSKNMGQGKPSMAAIEGTMMHLLFERGVEDEEFEPAEIEGESKMIEGQMLTVTADHVEKVYTALECLDDIIEKYDYDICIPEVIMNTDDETGGTADIIAIAQSKKVVINFGVHDLKTGDGYMVYAEKNDQLLFYAWQAVEHYKQDYKFNENTKFQLGIIQPSDRRDDPIDIWETDLKTILNFARKYKRAQKETKAGILTPCPGAHCKYCPAVPTCPAKTGLMKEAQARIPKGSKELTDLVWAMGVVDEAEDWCRAVRKAAHEQAEQGVRLTGFKLVAKRATRVWNDPAAARQRFVSSPKFRAEDYLDQKMKSAPQMEKVCKSKGVDFSQYESMISLHSSGTTLVKDTDKRPEALPLGAMGDMAQRLMK